VTDALVVAPPARLPWDVDEVALAAIDILRLDPSDVDAARINGLAVSATELVDSLLDFATAPSSVPGPVFDTAVNLTVESYRRKDTTDTGMLDVSMMQQAVDAAVRSSLTRYKSRFGLG
jgi:hypothetical protein